VAASLCGYPTVFRLASRVEAILVVLADLLRRFPLHAISQNFFFQKLKNCNYLFYIQFRIAKTPLRMYFK
jgi:hypothetical protein